MMDFDLLQEVFNQHMQGLVDRGATKTITFDPYLSVCIVSQLQLALRRKGNDGSSAAVARGFCEGMIDSLEEASPGLGAILRLGFDPDHDLRRGG